MKRNTQEVRNLLSQAYKNVPEDFALAEVKAQIRAALERLERVETKRERREQTKPQTNNWPVVNGQVVNPYAVKQTIDLIDEMIATEKRKIEEIHQRRKKSHDDEGEDDNGVQAIFG
jgi:hypothetical protein